MSKIKVGQVYSTDGGIYVVTRIWYNASSGRDWINCVDIFGETSEYSFPFVETYHSLIAEYPTWLEAVNSPEFRGEKKWVIY